MSEEAGPQAPVPWRVALVYAVLSAVFTGLYLAYPGFRLFPLPMGPVIPTAPMLALVPVASMAWAAAGIYRQRSWASRTACAVSLFAALGCLTIIGFSAWNEFVRA